MSPEELKTKVCGQLKLESITVDLYEDGTDGWATTDRYIYEGTISQGLNLLGISVHALDLRGLGASEGPEVYKAGKLRAMIDDFDYMAMDLIKFVEIIKEKYNDGVPIYLIGGSMGGTIVVRALEKYSIKGKLGDAAVLIAPCMQFCPKALIMLDKCARWILRSFALLNPLKQVAGSERDWDTDYKSLLKTDDPFCPNNYLYFRTAFNVLKGADDSIKFARRINPDIRILISHSTTDGVNFFEATEEFYNSLTQITKKNFVRLHNLGHWATFSPRFFAPLLDYISHWNEEFNKDRNIDGNSH